MAPPKKKTPFKKFQKSRIPSTGVQGAIWIDGERINVDFAYSEARVKALKTISGARFHSDNKRWSVPLKSGEKLLSHPLFSAPEIQKFVDIAFLAKPRSDQASLLLEASSVYKRDPFKVPAPFLAVLPLDVTFDLGIDPPSVRAFPRFHSKSESLIKKWRGVHYLPTERRYFIPTEEVVPLLNELRKEKITFGVEEACGKALSESAALRQELLSDKGVKTATKFKSALLFPYIDSTVNEEGERAFALHGETSIHRKMLLPAVTSPISRKKQAKSLTAREVLIIQEEAVRSDIHLFVTSTAADALEYLQEKLVKSSGKADKPLPQEIIRLIDAPLIWIRDQGGRCGACGSSDLLASLARLLDIDFKKLREEIYGKAYLPITDTKVLTAYDASRSLLEGKSNPPATEEFLKYLPELRRRQDLLKKRDSFLAQKESSLAGVPSTSPDTLPRLFPHQRVAVQWLLETPYAFLGDDMGLGKTLSLLSCFDILKEQDVVDFLIVIAPNSLTRNWRRECERWFPKRTLAVLPQQKIERLYLLKGLEKETLSYDGIVVNIEAARLPYVHPTLLSLSANRKTFLVIDESQRIKNPTSQGFQAVAQLAPFAVRRVLLSGTPTPKELSDIWAQLLLLDGGERLGKNFYRWLETVAELGNEFSEYAVKRYRPEGVAETISRLHEILLRRRKEDVINLPEKLFSIRDIEIGGDQKKRYDEIREELLLRITSLSGDTFVREITSVLEEYLRAVQIASNPRLIDDTWKGDPAKFVELDSIVDELVIERGEKIVVWTNFLKNVEELSERYKKLGARPFSGEVAPDVREETIRAFQEGSDCKILIAVPAAGGVGITLTAARTAVYIDKTWNAEHWLQSIDRLHRIGQKQSVHVITLSASKVDELIERNLRKKEDFQRELLGDAPSDMKVLIQKVPTREELIEALS